MIDTAALLTALHSCPNLTKLALVEPEHKDPAGLWEAAKVKGKDEDEKCAAATCTLLGQLLHVTSVQLSMPCVLPALPLLLRGGLGAKLQDLSLSGPHFKHSENQLSKLLTTSLKAMSSLTSLELLDLGIDWTLPSVLEACPHLGTTLRTLSIPFKTVEQTLLDAILKCLPGEGWGGAWVGGCRAGTAL